MDIKNLVKVADANSRTATKYNKVVNVDEAGTITVLQEVFSYGDGYKGATGAEFAPVSEEEYEESTSLEAVTEYIEGATELPEQYESYEAWAEDIIAAGEAGDLVFDQSYSSLWDMMREECGLSDEEAYIFDCIGGGRMFNANYQGNVNPELSEVIREAESK